MPSLPENYISEIFHPCHQHYQEREGFEILPNKLAWPENVFIISVDNFLNILSPQ